MQLEITEEYLASQGFSKTLPQRFWAKVDKNGLVPPHRPDLGPCWKWIRYRDPNGYGCIGRGAFGAGVERAHRASWILNVGPVPDGLEVCHKCDNTECSNPGHLFTGTHGDNLRDMASKGRSGGGLVCDVSGELNPNRVLCKNDVIQIRDAWRQGAGFGSLRRGFPISITQLRRIIKNESWISDHH